MTDPIIVTTPEALEEIVEKAVERAMQKAGTPGEAPAERTMLLTFRVNRRDPPWYENAVRRLVLTIEPRAALLLAIRIVEASRDALKKNDELAQVVFGPAEYDLRDGI